MFNRYWRDYPWFLQVILFGLMVFTFVSFSFLIGNLLLPVLTGYSLIQVANVNAFSSKALINAAILLQAVTSIGAFLLPPLIFAQVTHPSIKKYLSFNKPGKHVHWLLVVTMWIGALPLFLALGNLMKMVDLGAGANSMQTKVEDLTKAFLDMQNSRDFLRALFIMALLPAIGEEIFFRGVLLRLFYQKNHRFIFSGFVVSVMFAAAHGTPYNYIPIFIAGALLCFTFYLTGSLLCSMLAHCFYNGSQIFLAYFAGNSIWMKDAVQKDSVPLPIILAGAVIFGVSLYLLWKNRTPLQRNWADNFTPQELDEKAKDVTHL